MTFSTGCRVGIIEEAIAEYLCAPGESGTNPVKRLPATVMSATHCKSMVFNVCHVPIFPERCSVALAWA